ncbi:MAG: hypothetical protein ACO3JL_04185 [Myxococcota bacterium]
MKDRKSSVARARQAFVAAATAFLCGSGCIVTTYQPERGFARPVLVDTKATNLEGTRLLVRCYSSDDLSVGEAQKGCRRLAKAFSAQGAIVETEVPRPGKAQAPSFDGQGPELVLEWKSRKIKEDTFVASDLLFCMTCTCLPLVGEYVFAHEGEVRGRDGSVLLRDRYQARFVETIGCASGIVSFLLDLGRREEEKLGWTTQLGDPFGNETKATRDYSRDVYGQLSQLLYNAKARSDVLGLTTRRRPPSAGGPRTGDSSGTTSDEPAAQVTDTDAQAAGAPPLPAPPAPTPATDEQVPPAANNNVYDPAEGGPPAPPEDPVHATRQRY